MALQGLRNFIGSFDSVRRTTCFSVWSVRCLSTTILRPIETFYPNRQTKAITPTQNHNFQSVRSNIRNTYRPSAWKRIHKHGLEKRMSSPSQIGVLWRRLLKGRHNMSTFDGFLNPIRESKPRNNRINLTDPKYGYKINRKEEMIKKQFTVRQKYKM